MPSSSFGCGLHESGEEERKKVESTGGGGRLPP
jgi:hypothetical protein